MVLGIVGSTPIKTVKVPGRGTEMFIEGNAAPDASRRAQDLGIGPRIYQYLADRGVGIADHIEGRRASTNRAFQDPTVRNAVVELYAPSTAATLSAME
ncbi:hypothetical protein [Rhizobium indicum]|uniref:hypothetical protein n=1 Tax=Rhizobium indicum TaxID=2583231 RepID=UPI001FEE0B69|nr:hypothetical protein [Rhizobium indicum]